MPYKPTTLEIGRDLYADIGGKTGRNGQSYMCGLEEALFLEKHPDKAKGKGSSKDTTDEFRRTHEVFQAIGKKEDRDEYDKLRGTPLVDPPLGVATADAFSPVDSDAVSEDISDATSRASNSTTGVPALYSSFVLLPTIEERGGVLTRIPNQFKFPEEDEQELSATRGRGRPKGSKHKTRLLADTSLGIK
ncbi:uncharacterized protein BP5553_02105 [Venustampulla echinocandica]|uniref:J domain-containing protein n=1 Tax=Venustampulla echinocandica TaxID=2656787 RepID=A0A370U2W2_9HELO|nr:uncharacterized protein BP5553_02105 [Venustampulla echinocandica]RDL42126.1 hypothetical protein BP5553_02105 [Venustampulla echinocandica]